MNAAHYVFIRSRQPENGYGRFTIEILKSEGFNSFREVDLDAGEMPALGPADLVILTRCFLRDAEIDRICAAVEAGARLVCFQPSYRLAKRLGLASESRVLYPGWTKIREGYPGAGLPIQTHIPIVLYAFSQAAGEWEPLADAVPSDWSESGHPAVVRRKMGQGQVVLFFYDLPMAVALIRFGNPDLASYCTTGLWDWVHAGDLFVGQVDERVNHLPQADFHGQFLARILTDLCAYPLPRLWYYEKAAHRTAAVFQSDDDMSTVDQFNDLSAALVKNGGAATFYLMKNTRMSEADVADFRRRGHTFAAHANPGSCRDERYYDFPEVVREETRLLKNRFGACSQTIQCHCAPWQGYMHWLPDFISSGYRLLFAYISLPISMLNRYMCGSGRAMRFYDHTRRKLYDCWQQPLVSYDDLSVKPKYQTRPQEVIAEFKSLLRPALEQTHTAIPILSHPVSFSTYSKPVMDVCLGLLKEEGVPIYNADRWCDLLDRRQAVRIVQEVKTKGGIRCTVENLRGELTLMVPLRAGRTATLQISVNGARAEGVIHRRLEQDYLFIPMEGKDVAGTLTVDISSCG